MVATILYNAAVRQLDNPSLQIRKHGYHAISRRLGSIDMQLTQPTSKTLVKAACILTVKNKTINDEENLGDDSSLQEKLSHILRLATGIKNVKQVYRSVYDFAACICPDINRKSDEFLDRRWESLRRAQNYSRNKKNEEKKLKQSSIEPIGSEVRLLPIRPEPREFVAAPAQPKTNEIAQSSSGGLPSFSASLIPSEVERIQPATRPTKPTREILSQECKAALLEYAASVPKGTHGKWANIHALYLKLNPAGKLNENALCCRLKQRSRNSKQPSEISSGSILESPTPIPSTSVVVQQSPALEQIVLSAEPRQLAPGEANQDNNGPACESCRSRKRGCNPNSKNPDCEKRKKN